jgi:beta-lactamase class A
LGSLVTPPSEADATPHFSSDFLAVAPASKVVGVFGQLAKGGPWTLEKVIPQDPASPALMAVIRSGSGPKFNVRLKVGGGADALIAGLLFQPALDAKLASSWDEVLAMLRDAAPQANMLAAEVNGSTCTPVSSLDPKKPLALGSAFKLYILDALATQIAAGKHGWDDPLPIQEALKSLPSGDMRDEPAGKTFSVRHFAEQMISVSDNTATDHLLAFVGRTAVEADVKATGHAKPSLLTPFMSTRELFALKVMATPDQQSAYVAADVAHKRKLLETLAKSDPNDMMAHAADFKRPIHIDTLEYFASPEDLCKVMASLHAKASATATAPVGAILSINPGLPDEKKQYSFLGYKGGSEPGVLNMTWLMQRARDQKWVFLTVGFNNTTDPLDEAKVIAAAATAREFLGR